MRERAIRQRHQEIQVSLLPESCSTAETSRFSSPGEEPIIIYYIVYSTFSTKPCWCRTPRDFSKNLPVWLTVQLARRCCNLTKCIKLFRIQVENCIQSQTSHSSKAVQVEFVQIRHSMHSFWSPPYSNQSVSVVLCRHRANAAESTIIALMCDPRYWDPI